MPVIGTAGHVDHGKSALLERLTGKNPMHLPEEFSRGLTIELGFGYWKSPSGVECGVVDVPGHGHFIRNMAGGAFALDAVVFVVAADDGWKPQTEEHLFILDSSKVPAGIVVINKSDLVGEDRISELKDELEIRLENTFLENAPIVSVSATKGTGINSLEEQLGYLIANLAKPDETGLVRLWIDRVFKIEGTGSVITGTLKGGSVNAGDQMSILPSGDTARVRRIQMHGREVQSANQGSRVAINIAVSGRIEIERGMLFCSGNNPQLSDEAWVTIKIAPSWDAKLKNGGKYLAHIGTRSVGVKVYPRKSAEDPEIGEGVARVVFDEPTPLERGNIFQIFSSAKHGVVASCEVAVPSELSKKFRDIADFNRLLRDSLEAVENYILFRIAAGPIAESDLQKSSGVSSIDLNSAISTLIKAGKITLVQYGGSSQLIAKEQFEQIDRQIVEKVARLRKENSAIETITAAQLELPVKLESSVLTGIMAQASAKIEGAIFSGGVIQIKRSIESDILDDPKAKQILAKFRGDIAGFPSLRQLYDLFPRDKRVIGLLLEKGHLLKLPDEMLIPSNILDRIERTLRELIKRKGEISVADAKEAWGVTRKHVIPLLEYFDNRQITKRQDMVRIKGPKFGE